MTEVLPPAKPPLPVTEGEEILEELRRESPAVYAAPDQAKPAETVRLPLWIAAKKSF